MRSLVTPLTRAVSGLLLLGSIAGLCGPVATAHADEGLPLTVRLVPDNPNSLPAPGDILRATLELTSEVEIGVQNVHVESGRDPQGNDHWQTLLVNTPLEFTLSPGVPQAFAVHVIANDPSEPFEIAFQAGSHSVKERFFALPPSNVATQSLPATFSVIGTPLGPESPANGSDPAIDLWTTPPPFETPPGTVLADRPTAPGSDDDTQPAARGALIQIKGTLAYTRGDAATIGVDGATVLVYDSDVGDDDLLGIGVTKANGTFDFSVWRGTEAGPEVYLVFCAANGMINVQFPWLFGDVESLSNSIKVESSLYPDMTADLLDVGTVSAGDGALNPNAAFHILSTLTKAWRYVGGLGFNSQLDRVRVMWPAPTGNAFYRASEKAIYMNMNRQWQEDTIIHEFGHHWVHHYSASADAEYCNPGGFQDPPGQDCGHNQWCNENQDVAWSEGLPNFLADMATNWIEDHYHSIVNDGSIELLSMCGENSQFGDPYKTESILGGLLLDIADFSNENDPAFGSVGIDKLGQGVASVLAAASSGLVPSTPGEFLINYQALNPGLGNSFWSTAMNNGYDVDQHPPGWPANLTSSSHSTTGDSPDGTVDLSWDPPTDDSSGVRRYIVEVASTPSYPGGAGSFYSTYPYCTTPELAPGTWWITVLAEDWSGKQGVNYATFGPVTIREPSPPDFAMDAGAFWPYAVVPRRTDDTTLGYAPLPNFISGDQPETWFNYRVKNVGEAPNPVTVMNRLWVDGVQTNATSVPELVPLFGGSARIFYNQGPYTIRGGRHMISVRTDADEVMPELDEADNLETRQFVWAPAILVNDPVDRAAPPDPYGGIVIPTPFTSVNCDGLGYLGLNSLAPFTGLAILPADPGDDPDLRSFPHTTGPLNGFSLLSQLADSSRRAGAVDAVITNTTLAPAAVVDAGIRRTTSMSAGYRAWPLASTQLPTSTDVQLTLRHDEYILLHHFLISDSFGSQHGTIRVSIDPQGDPVWAALIDPDDEHFGLDDATVVGKTAPSGRLTLNFTYDTPLHGLVLYRDRPTDGSAAESLPVSVWVGPTPANFTAALGLSGWSSPVTPTYGLPGSPSSVPPPGTLVGGVASTFVNTAIANDGPNPGVPLEQWTLIDDGFGPGAQSSGITPGGVFTQNFATALTVPGGRHTMWMSMDPNDLVSESDEADNLWGRQWVWTPTQLTTGPAIDFSAPGDPIGGIDAVLTAQTGVFHLNCVGLRDAAPVPSGEDGHWRAVAVMPGAASDVDVRLHDAAAGVLSGFRDVRSSSNWGTGQSDYVLTNFRALSAQPMDIGVVAVSGTETFMAQTVESVFLADEPQGVYGDFALGTRELVNLHEMRLRAGKVIIDLIPVGDPVDLGMTLHRANLPWQSKAPSQTSPGAWDAPAGQTETLIADVPEDGAYCLAVWKVGAGDAAIDARYRLDIRGLLPTTSPPSPVVTRTTLRSLQPNPFNPRTVVHFDLEQGGHVDLRVLDLRGALVTRLLAAELPAGRHHATWNGQDRRGRPVASGVYFVALSANGIREVKKAVLVK